MVLLRRFILGFIIMFIFTTIPCNATDSQQIKINSNSVGSGIIFNESKGGEIYGGIKEGTQDPNNWLTLKAGDGGVRVVSKDGSRDLIMVDNFGGIYINGDLYLNNERLNPKLSNIVDKKYVDIVFSIVLGVLLLFILSMFLLILKLRKELANVKNTIKFERG